VKGLHVWGGVGRAGRGGGGHYGGLSMHHACAGMQGGDRSLPAWGCRLMDLLSGLQHRRLQRAGHTLLGSMACHVHLAACHKAPANTLSKG